METLIIIGIVLLCITQTRIIIGSVLKFMELTPFFKILTILELTISTFALIVLITTYFQK